MGEGSDLDVTAQSLRGVSNVLLDVHAAVLDEGLIDEASFLVELAQLANSHLLFDGVGLVGGLGIVGHLSQNDLLLLGQNVSGDVGLVQVAGVSSSDLHGDVLAEGSELSLGSNIVRSLELDDDAVGAAAMDISGAVTLVTSEAANLDVLLDDKDQSLQGVVNRALAHLASHQGLNVGGVLVSNDLGQVLGEVNKLVVLGDEVGLGVDLNDDSAVGVRNGIDHALGGDTASLLVGSSQTLLAQDLDCLLEVAVSLSQCLLALHHAAVGLLTQFHNVLCRNSHSSQCPF